MKYLSELYTDHQQIILNKEDSFRRFYINEIDWEERLNIIVGARGVGKTTAVLQHIAERHNTSEEALYVSMDDLNASQYRLLDIAKAHYENGGTHLYIDEIHKYANWSQELKNINDKYRKIKVVASGSSILEIQKGNADLSRRAVEWHMPGLSLREYINVETGLDLAKLTVADIVSDHISIAHDIVKNAHPGQFFSEYLRYGYYPFYLEGKRQYGKKLNNVLNTTLEIDLPYTLGVDVSKIDKLKKLIYILTTQAPFTPNISKLGSALELDRGTLYRYLNYLERASIIKMLWKEGKSYSLLSKPDKLYLHNTNLFYLTQREVNIGTLRESFFVNQVSYAHDIRLPVAGDFIVDGKYTFEVGGAGKSYKQIADIPNSYVIADNLLVGTGNKIPVWLFGFLY